MLCSETKKEGLSRKGGGGQHNGGRMGTDLMGLTQGVAEKKGGQASRAGKPPLIKTGACIRAGRGSDFKNSEKFLEGARKRDPARTKARAGIPL